jgi:hypothetical protein
MGSSLEETVWQTALKRVIRLSGDVWLSALKDR